MEGAGEERLLKAACSLGQLETFSCSLRCCWHLFSGKGLVCGREICGVCWSDARRWALEVILCALGCCVWDIVLVSAGALNTGAKASFWWQIDALPEQTQDDMNDVRGYWR